MRYLLTCDCGREIPVATSQAGDTLTCECGRSLQAPKLRELRELPAVQEAPAPRRRLAWSPTKGILFSLGGILLLVAAIVLGITSLQRSRLATDKFVIPPEDVGTYVAQIDKNTPVQNFEVWTKEILGEGLTRPGDPTYVVHRRYDAILGRITLVAGIAAGIGVALMFASLVMPAQGQSTKPIPAKSRAS